MNVTLAEAIAELQSMGQDVELEAVAVDRSTEHESLDRERTILLKVSDLIAAFQQMVLEAQPGDRPWLWICRQVDAKSNVFVRLIWPQEEDSPFDVAWDGTFGVTLSRPRTSPWISFAILRGPDRGDDWRGRRVVDPLGGPAVGRSTPVPKVRVGG